MVHHRFTCNKLHISKMYWDQYFINLKELNSKAFHSVPQRIHARICWVEFLTNKTIILEVASKNKRVQKYPETVPRTFYLLIFFLQRQSFDSKDMMFSYSGSFYIYLIQSNQPPRTFVLVTEAGAGGGITKNSRSQSPETINTIERVNGEMGPPDQLLIIRQASVAVSSGKNDSLILQLICHLFHPLH